MNVDRLLEISMRFSYLVADFCLDIAGKWGVGRVWAETTTDNPRILSIFENRDFSFGDADGDEMLVNKDLIQAKANHP